MLCYLDFVDRGIEACKCEWSSLFFFFFYSKYSEFSFFYFLFYFIFSQPGPIPLTIENVLFNALVKVGAVSQDNADNPTKVRL